MAIIELNLEKPALKRVESGGKRESRSEMGTDSSSHHSEMETGSFGTETGTSSVGTSTSGVGSSSVDTSDEPAMDDYQSDADPDQSGGKSRFRKYGRRMVLLGGTAAGVAAARKLRQRRKSGSKQQDLDDDWQTADTSTATGTGTGTGTDSSSVDPSESTNR